MSDIEIINPYLKKKMYDLMNQPIVPTDELKRIIGYQDVIPTTFQEVSATYREIEVKLNETYN